MALTINSEMNFISYIVFATQTIFILVAVYAICKYIKQYIYTKAENRFQKKLFYSGLLFFILTVATILFLFIDLLINEFEQMLAAILLALYGFQMFFLDLVTFIRVYLLFNASPIKSFQMSKCCVRTYQILLTLQIVMIIFVPVLFILNKIKLVFLIIIALIFISIILNASLATLFIYKLVKVQKLKNIIGDKNENEDFLNYVRKNSILTITSCISTILTIISFFMVHKIDPDSRLYIDISILCLSLDCYTNFTAIALTFNYFKWHYKTLCGCMDKSCKLSCGQLTLPAPTKEIDSSGNGGETQVNDLATNAVQNSNEKKIVVVVSEMTQSGETMNRNQNNVSNMVMGMNKMKNNDAESPQSPLMMDDTLANMYKLSAQKVLS